MHSREWKLGCFYSAWNYNYWRKLMKKKVQRVTRVRKKKIKASAQNDVVSALQNERHMFQRVENLTNVYHNIFAESNLSKSCTKYWSNLVIRIARQNACEFSFYALQRFDTKRALDFSIRYKIINLTVSNCSSAAFGLNSTRPQH